MGSDVIVNAQYREWLKDLKQRVRNAQLKAAVSVNTMPPTKVQVMDRTM